MSDDLRTIRTTLWPDRDLQVSEREYHSLRRQGLVLDDTPAAGSQDEPGDAKPQDAPVAPTPAPKSARRTAADDDATKEN